MSSSITKVLSSQPNGWVVEIEDFDYWTFTGGDRLETLRRWLTDIGEEPDAIEIKIVVSHGYQGCAYCGKDEKLRTLFLLWLDKL